MSTILITGATGALGSATIDHLLKLNTDHKIIGLARSEEKAASLKEKGVEEAVEVFQAHPGCINNALDAAERRNIFKCDDNTGHREIVEDDEIEYAGQRQQIIKSKLPYLSA